MSSSTEGTTRTNLTSNKEGNDETVPEAVSTEPEEVAQLSEATLPESPLQILMRTAEDTLRQLNQAPTGSNQDASVPIIQNSADEQITLAPFPHDQAEQDASVPIIPNSADEQVALAPFSHDQAVPTNHPTIDDQEFQTIQTVSNILDQQVPLEYSIMQNPKTQPSYTENWGFEASYIPNNSMEVQYTQENVMSTSEYLPQQVLYYNYPEVSQPTN